jgi:alkanesulfonate monooxygenase SsuD/methylene tetrahydromethanopterin reductase-like flavin-dependent oxidoreductase (luciferase family)
VAQASADESEADDAAVWLRETPAGSGATNDHQIDEGKHYRVNGIDPAPVAAPEVWTGSSGPKSLAVTGRVADGWLSPYFADWLSERYRPSRPVIDEAPAAAGPRSRRGPHDLQLRRSDHRPAADRDPGRGRPLGRRRSGSRS